MKIRLNNKDYTKSTDGLDEFKVTYSLDSTNTVNVSSTSTLVFKGDAYDYLYSVFFAERDGFQQVVDVSISVNCAGWRTYSFILRFDTVSWCPFTCEIRANLIKLDDKTKCFEYLNTKVFWKHGLLGQLNNAQYFSKMNYLVNVTNAIRALWGLWNAARFLGLGIIDWFNETFGDGNGFVNRTEDWLSGAGDFHIAFNVNKAIEYNIQQCGLIWKSSILQGNYSNMYWLQAYGSQGIDQRFKTDQQKVKKLAEENLANLTTINILELLTDVFYGQYRIFKDTVYFENPDFFRELAVKLSSVSELQQQNLLADTFCFDFIQPEGNAYGRFEYVDDPVETYGNKAKLFYNDIVEWNSPPEDWQKGELNNIVNFSPTAFMFDQFDETDVAIQADRQSSSWGREHKNEIYLDRGQSANGKLVILQDIERGIAQHRQIPTNNPVPLYYYNEAMSFREGPVPPNLYSRYHAKQDPRRTDRELYEIAEITIKFTSAFLDLVDTEGVNVYILTAKGKAIPTEIEVDFKLGIMRLKNLRC